MNNGNNSLELNWNTRNSDNLSCHLMKKIIFHYRTDVGGGPSQNSNKDATPQLYIYNIYKFTYSTLQLLSIYSCRRQFADCLSD